MWETSDLKAQQLQIELTLHLLKNAVSEVKAAHAALADAQVSDDAEAVSKAKAAVAAAGGYHKFALRMREHSKVSGVLKLARSALEIKPDALDANPFEINTPSGLVCLRTGVQSGHRPEALCTKMTRFAPSDEGMNEWLGLVETITVFDEEYQRFLQHLAGAIAVGKVYTEAMVIAHGSGANGKSTFFNTLAAVLGDYAGKIPAEALTTRAKNVKVDLAELLGKRLIIASETEEGQRISTGMVKQVASVDTITAERKYHDPFTFQPSHTLILYTNHLPKVGSGDHGTWRRLVVAPFGAVIHNPQTDYAEKLLAKSGGAVMKWIIEGAMMFIAGGFKLPRCAAVENAVARYRQENDWLSAFLTERCNVALGERCFGGELYAEYRRWAGEQGEYIRSTSDFTAALVSAGFERKKTKAGAVWFGLSVCEVQPFLAASDAVRKPTACAR